MKRAALALIAAAALSLGACATKAPQTTYPAPTSYYSCEDGTRLAVRLLGNEASVAVNGAAPISIPAQGSAGTTFTNGRQTLTIVQGQVSWALGRAMPTMCVPSGS